MIWRVALGADSGISESEVCRICERLDETVGAFRTRPFEHIALSCVYFDATYRHVRNQAGKGGQVALMAVVVATGIAADGSREVLGLDLGDSVDLLSLKQRGLGGVRLVISDQHSVLVAALNRSFQGAAHQRCRVHFARNLLAQVPKTHADVVAAVFRTIFAQPDPDAVHGAWEHVRDQLTASFPKAGPVMDGAKAEVLAFTTFPKAHSRKIWSTNPLPGFSGDIEARQCRVTAKGDCPENGVGGPTRQARGLAGRVVMTETLVAVVHLRRKLMRAGASHRLRNSRQRGSWCPRPVTLAWP
jgi:putative transposase